MEMIIIKAIQVNINLGSYQNTKAPHLDTVPMVGSLVSVRLCLLMHESYYLNDMFGYLFL